MADDIDIANDVFGTGALKPAVGEEINTLWGRKIAANLGELWRGVMYDTVNIFTAAGGQSPDGGEGIGTSGVLFVAGGGDTVRLPFHWFNHGSRGTMAAMAMLYANGGTTYAAIESSAGVLSSGGTLTPALGSAVFDLGTVAHGQSFGSAAVGTIYLSNTGPTNDAAIFSITIFNWGTP